MNEPHIAQIGNIFDVESFHSMSSQNLLEYDMILIDGRVLMEEINDAEHKKYVLLMLERLTSFIENANMPLVIYCTESMSLNSLNHNDSRNLLEMFNLDLEIEAKKGGKIDTNRDNPKRDFFDKYNPESEYYYTFSKHPGVSIGQARNSFQAVGFYTKDFIVLPDLKDYHKMSFYEYFGELYTLCKSIRKGDIELILPDWTINYHVPQEEQMLDKISKVDHDLGKLLAQKKTLEHNLDSHRALKMLWTASGTVLEMIVKKVFEELGFKSLPTAENRDDLLLSWKGRSIVVEVKGLTKSAAERNAAQLEKFLSMHLEIDGKLPKGLLVVNTYRNLPLANRTEVSFPNQMLDYSIKREHCLITTIQLCTLLFYVRDNPDQIDSVVEGLLACIGPYEEFPDWSKYIVNKGQKTKYKMKST